MSHDPLDYNLLLQEALRGLVKRSLEIVAEEGFPGDHHFYVTFRTGAPGVVMAPQLRQSYPEEMTIVLKTQFRDLIVEDEWFSVGLFFSGVRHDLTVPFAALMSFTDPEVGFQLAFQGPSKVDDDGPEPVASEPSEEAPSEKTEEAEATPDNVVSFPGARGKG